MKLPPRFAHARSRGYEHPVRVFNFSNKTKPCSLRCHARWGIVVRFNSVIYPPISRARIDSPPEGTNSDRSLFGRDLRRDRRGRRPSRDLRRLAIRRDRSLSSRSAKIDARGSSSVIAIPSGFAPIRRFPFDRKAVTCSQRSHCCSVVHARLHAGSISV